MPITKSSDLLWVSQRTRLVPETGCWEWTLTKERPPLLAYGRCYFGKRYRHAHRVVWELLKGPIPEGMCVLHRCDNPPCCNPDHLFLGTLADNAADRDAKGRTAKGDRSGARRYPERWSRGDKHWTRLRPNDVPVGEDAATAKLSASDVFDIRQKRNQGVTLQRLAIEFGVGISTIARIAKGVSWQSVDGQPVKYRRLKVHEATVAVLRRMKEPAVTVEEEGLCLMIADELKWEHKGRNTARRVIAQLNKSFGVLVKTKVLAQISLPDGRFKNRAILRFVLPEEAG